MRRLRSLLMLCPLLCWGQPAEWQAKSEEEALFLRRIADFWQEGEYQIAKSQMEEFLETYPKSAFSEPLCAALGDLALREKNYSSALNYYAHVADADLASRIFLNRMQCLYHMEWYATLADECEAFLSKESLESTQKLQATYYLGIALYRQCLNAAKDPETLQKLALRAQPYFETLFQSELNQEVAAAFAHLCCILKDFPRASSIYLDLAKKNSGEQEEMLFQAALIQAEYDKELASQTFGEIAQKGKTKEKEAAYNRFVLLFDLKKYEELTRTKDEIFEQIPADRAGMAHLFLGRSFLALKKYPEANFELKAFIENGEKGEMLRAALISLLDSSFQSNDFGSLDFALSKMTTLYPKDPEISKARFSRALMLKRDQQKDLARKELEDLLSEYPQFSQRAQASFELAHLDYQAKAWESCRNKTLSFLSQFPEHELSSFAWRYLISSSLELSSENPGNAAIKKQLATDIEMLLGQKKLLSPEEKCNWQFLLAKANFELGKFEDSIRILQEITSLNTSFMHEANAYLLLALCHKERFQDLFSFCSYSEIALEKKADLVDLGSLHGMLFNAYLQRSEHEVQSIEKAANHLFAAFEAKTPIQVENIIWLSDLYYSKFEKDLEENKAPSIQDIKKAIALLEHLIKSMDPIEESQKLLTREEKTSSQEEILQSSFYKLAKFYSHLDRKNEAVALLEKLISQQQSLSNTRSKWEKPTLLLLAECYEADRKDEALMLYDSIAKEKSMLRTMPGALACLKGARLRLAKCSEENLTSENPFFIQALSQLKDLVLQKNFANEPLHLEAAIDYIELHPEIEKQIALLTKTKKDFENTADLLSNDYHQARLNNPKKDKVYQSYMRYFEAETLALQSVLNGAAETQKDLQAKAKDLLLQIMDENAHPFIVERARKRLENVSTLEQKT